MLPRYRRHSEQVDAGADAIGVYSALREEMLARIVQQGKCVELSIIISAGLLAAIAGTQWLSDELRPNQPLWLAFATVAFYCFLQGSLLTNYVYQRWLIGGIHEYILDATRAGEADMYTSRLRPGGWERNMSTLSRRGLPSRTANLIELLQPILIYGALTIGTVALLVLSAKLTVSGASSWELALVWFVALFVVVCGVVIAALHRAICTHHRPKTPPKPRQHSPDRVLASGGVLAALLLLALWVIDRLFGSG